MRQRLPVEWIDLFIVAIIIGLTILVTYEIQRSEIRDLQRRVGAIESQEGR